LVVVLEIYPINMAKVKNYSESLSAGRRRQETKHKIETKKTVQNTI